MNRFNIKKYVITHPFGEDMTNNVSSAKKMAEDFISISRRDILKSKNIVLVCMGSSGAMVSTLFHLIIKKKYKNANITVCHIKKENEESYGERVSGLCLDDKTLYVWVDDFVESGATIHNCWEVLKEYFQTKGVNFKSGEFKFDYVVCSTINPKICKLKDIEGMTNNIVYNYL